MGDFQYGKPLSSLAQKLLGCPSPSQSEVSYGPVPGGVIAVALSLFAPRTAEQVDRMIPAKDAVVVVTFRGIDWKRRKRSSTRLNRPSRSLKVSWTKPRRRASRLKPPRAPWSSPRNTCGGLWECLTHKPNGYRERKGTCRRPRQHLTGWTLLSTRGPDDPASSTRRREGLVPRGAVWYGRRCMPPAAAGMNGHILVVDDDRETCELVKEVLEHEGFKVTSLTSAIAALARVIEEDFDAVLTDLGMAELDGISLCKRILEARPDLPVLVGTGQGSMETAIAAMRAGAYDFVTKPFDPKLLALSVGRGVQNHRLRDELKRLRQNLSSLATPGFIGRSAAMRRVSELVSRVADSEASVLIQGETGTGKELVARLIHSSGKRKSGPFVAINCAAVPHALIESELFGHARGAFTDARNERTGLFVEANGGTLFLDEIGELPIDTQPKLLRALQERTVRPVGSNAEQPFDVRIVAATNRDLEFEVFEKRFREDLFYRINVVGIELPPLRNRGGDVLEIAQHLLGRLAERAGKSALKLSDAAAEKLVAYGWPGNVRELENCLERGVALARFDQLTPEDLPDKIRNYRAEKFVVAADDPTEVVTLETLERNYILRVLTLVGGNKSQAAQMLGVDRRTLYRKLARYENPGARAGDADGEAT